MKTFTNTKDIPVKLFYDLIKNNFKEMFPKKSLQYALTDNIISVEKDGILLYQIMIDDEVITVAPIDDKKNDIGKKLEKFIAASLLE